MKTSHPIATSGVSTLMYVGDDGTPGEGARTMGNVVVLDIGLAIAGALAVDVALHGKTTARKIAGVAGALSAFYAMYQRLKGSAQ